MSVKLNKKLEAKYNELKKTHPFLATVVFGTLPKDKVRWNKAIDRTINEMLASEFNGKPQKVTKRDLREYIAELESLRLTDKSSLTCKDLYIDICEDRIDELSLMVRRQTFKLMFAQMRDEAIAKANANAPKRGRPANANKS